MPELTFEQRVEKFRATATSMQARSDFAASRADVINPLINEQSTIRAIFRTEKLAPGADARYDIPFEDIDAVWTMPGIGGIPTVQVEGAELHVDTFGLDGGVDYQIDVAKDGRFPVAQLVTQLLKNKFIKQEELAGWGLIKNHAAVLPTTQKMRASLDTGVTIGDSGINGESAAGKLNIYTLNRLLTLADQIGIGGRRVTDLYVSPLRFGDLRNQVTMQALPFSMRERLYGGGSDPKSGVPEINIHRVYNQNLVSDLKGYAMTQKDSYDLLGRMTADIVAAVGTGVDGSVRRLGYTFNTQGLPELFTSYSNTSGTTVVNQDQREYNGLGQMTAEYQSHSGAVNTSTTPVVGYTYSEMSGGANHSRLTAMTYPDGRVLTYSYATGLDNSISRLSSLSDSSGTLESYTYLGLSTIIERDRSNAGKLTFIGTSGGDGGDIYRGLNRFGQVIDQRWANSSDTTVDQYIYTYDRNGNVTGKANALNGDFSETYTYDGLNRLTSTTRDGTAHQSWSLDALGNSSSVTTDTITEDRTYNAQNQLTGMGSATLAFDANGNETLDQNGLTFVYDAWNRQVEVKNGETSVQSYAFDALGRRITEGGREIFYSANWQQIEERDTTTDDVVVQNVWSAVYVDALVERDRDTDANGTLDERLYVMQDANFNVTGIVSASGAVLERFAYDAYGKRTVLNATTWVVTSDAYAFQNGHQGGKIDAVSGKLYFRNRIYDVDSMRWMSVDQLLYVDGSNPYLALGANPLSGVDPWGLADVPPGQGDVPPIGRIGTGGNPEPVGGYKPIVRIGPKGIEPPSACDPIVKPTGVDPGVFSTKPIVPRPGPGDIATTRCCA
jgi:RHS repeat-associated protein